jgi:DNA polymerase-1
MIAHHMVLSDVPNDLAFASSLYTQLPYWKHLSDSNLRFYNANDVDATIQLYTVLRQKLHMYGMDHVFETSMRVIPVLRAMKTTGVLVDSKRRLRYLVALDMHIKALERELMEKVQDPLFNWQSTKQLAELLYGKLGLPKMLNKKTGGVTTNEEALQDLYDHTHAPILAILLKLRKASKLASTYFEDQAAPSGRVHGEYLLHGTATGRLSSRSPNLQNIPKGPARSIYVPTPGNIFIQADYNQIELRVAAFLAREETLLEAFKQGLDVHRLVASEVYGKPMADITEDERFRAKFIVYGLGYGRGAASIAKQYNMSKTAAEAFIAKYFARFSKIKAWRTELIREAQKNGFLANAFGRRRWFFDQQMHTKVYNFPPQSTAADILLCALVKLHDELPEPARLVLTVHDSVLVECPPEQEATVIECMRTIMQQEYLPGLPVPVKIKSGLDWSACD